MKLFNCSALAVLVLSLIASTHQRLRPFHGGNANRLLNRLLSATRHRSPRLHRKSSIERYSIQSISGDDEALRTPSRTRSGGVVAKGERRFFLNAEGRGRTLRKRAHLKTTKPRNVLSYKSAPSYSASYGRDGKSARAERRYRAFDQRELRLRKSKNPSKPAHAGDKQGSVKANKSRKGKRYKKYGFIQAYIPRQYQSQLPLTYQQFQQNDGASQAGYLPVMTSDQSSNPDTEQGGNSNAVPQMSFQASTGQEQTAPASYQATAGQGQTALFANSDAAEESQQPTMNAEQLRAQQQVAYAQLSQQEEGEQQSTANQEGQDQEGLSQEGQNQEGLSQEGQNQEGLSQEGQNQEGLSQEGQNQEGQTQEGQNQEGLDEEGLTQEERAQQPGAGLVQGDLRQSDAQQEATQPGGEGQGISDGNSLESMFSLGNQAGQTPLGGEQRLAGYTGEVTSTQQENRDAPGPDTTAQYQTSLEAALKEPVINGDNGNSQGESQSFSIGGDGGETSQDTNAAGTDPNNGRVTSPGLYQTATADDNGNLINVGGNNAGVNGFSPISGQSFTGEESNLDGASQLQQLEQQPSIQSILEGSSGHMRPADPNSPTQPIDDEVYKILNIANGNAPNHVKGCVGCPPHAQCIHKVCIINDDQPLAHVLSALSGSEASDAETAEKNCTACHYNAKCTKNADCVCKAGYTGDGYDCRPDTCLPGCKEHGKCINGFCVCDHHHYFNGHSCSPYKISHQKCPPHCLKNCSQACPPKCCLHNKHLNNGTFGGALSDGYQVTPSSKPMTHYKAGDNETNPHESAAAVIAQPSKGLRCPASCHTQCLDSCPEKCCKPCPANCTAKCQQSCPGHCCDPTEPTRPSVASMNSNKLQGNIFREIAEKFCPRACTKHCDPNTCPPICCDGSSITLLTGLKKDGKSIGADAVKNALSWFGMMNLLNTMYDAYGNNSTRTGLTQISNDAVTKQAGTTATSDGKDNAKDTFLLDHTANKCLPTCSKICSPLCPPNCCTKDAATTRPVVQASQCPPTCRERCSGECSPSCCVLFGVQSAERAVARTSPGSHAPGGSRIIVGSATSPVAPTHETQTAVQAPSVTLANSAPSRCSSICPAYCYPVCSRSCCTGTARSGGQTPIPGATTRVGQPLTAYAPAHPELKPACTPQCIGKSCGPTCPKQCCGATPVPSRPTTFVTTIKDKVVSACPSVCDTRCSPSCPEGCCAAAKVATQDSEGRQPPITVRSCAPQCARFCYPICDRRCCKGAAAKSTAARTKLPEYPNRISCPLECRPFHCLSYCHHECCLRDSAPRKFDASQAAYVRRGPDLIDLKQRYSNPKVHSGPSATLDDYRLNSKIIKSRGKVSYSLGHKSKRKNIVSARKQPAHSF